MGQGIERIPENETPDDAFSAPLRRVLGDRFAFQRRLNEVQGTRTYLGTDLSSGEAVVIKAVPLDSLPPGTLMRLDHEAALLCRIRSESMAPQLYARNPDR